MRELITRIEIAAPPGRIWEILTDFASYTHWNPLLTRIEGDLEVGGRLQVRFRLPGGGGMTLRTRIKAVGPERELRWVGSVVIPGIFDGEHIFQLEPVGDDKTRFTQAERFSGVLVPLFGSFIGRTRRGFEAMNQALKARAEACRHLPQDTQQRHAAIDDDALADDHRQFGRAEGDH